VLGNDEPLQDKRGAKGHLLDNLVVFGRLLRALGFDVSPGRIMEVTRALDVINLGNREEFYFAARASLVSGKEDLPLFDAAFEAFWRVHSRGPTRQMGILTGRQPPRAHPQLVPPSLNPPEPDDGSQQGQVDDQPLIEVTMTYSARATLRQKDFSELTSDEMEEVKSLIASFVWQLGERRTRRFRPGGDAKFDLRRTVRRNLRYGGEIMQWAYREPAYKPRPLVLIADISGSMDRYTRLLLRFCYGMSRSLKQPVEAFVFSTQLTRITWQLRRRDVDLALEEIGQRVSDWSGGTRIGEALKAFNYGWGQRVLGRGAVVILISDGWDRGDIDLLRREMARLKRTCYRLIWLNPLLGGQSYEPTARGMEAALPHIDDFLPVHNLASLEGLAAHLASLSDRAGLRRTYARHHP